MGRPFGFGSDEGRAAGPAVDAALGAAAGLALWLGAWVLHHLARPDSAAAGDPLFWILGTAPFTLAGFGWLAWDHRRVKGEADGYAREHRRRGEELEIREALRRSMLGDSFDAVLVVGIDGRVEEANASATRLLGYTGAELVEMPIGQILPEVTVRDPTPTQPSRARHADGSQFEVEVRLSRVEAGVQVYTVRERSGQVSSALAELETGRKVVDQRRRSATLQTMVSALRARVRRISDWVNEGTVDPASVQPLVALADDLAHDADQLANLLMWDRADGSPTIGPVDLAVLLDEIVAELRLMPQLRHDRLTIEVDPQLGPVVTDPSQIAIVLRNVIAHELRRARDGTVSVEVVREPGRGSDWVTVMVHHVGRELSGDEIDRIHTAFAQSADPHPTADPLLGLALGQRLARALGGHLAVESVPGQGTTLSMRIPMDPARARVVPHRSLRPMPGDGAAPSLVR